ncbi:MAG: helix-turn-helix domain-containing protein [Patescibacteria group bacterium]
MQNVHFTPPQLAQLFDVNVSTIKRWVDRGYLEAEVTAGGHRRVNRDQLTRFIRRYPKYSRAYTLKRLGQQRDDIADDRWQQYYDLLQQNNMKQAAQFIDRLYITNVPIQTIISRVIMPALRHMGELYQAKKISVYEEHRMSFLLRMHVIRLDGYIPDTTDAHSPSVILACAPGEFNELPLQIIALQYKLHGWKTHVLGINIGIEELKKASARIRPQMIVPTKTYTDRPSTRFFNALTTFAAHHGIILGFGGPIWKKWFSVKRKKCWSNDPCVLFFNGLKDFEKFLAEYKPGAKRRGRRGSP